MRTFITAGMPVFLKSDSRTPFHHLKFPCTCRVPHLGEFAVFDVFHVSLNQQLTRYQRRF